jgi:hypothetical protein
MDADQFGMDDPMPLDVAVGFMSIGYDLNTLEGYNAFVPQDPYFND